jgi:hypothetical protein
MLFDGVRHFTLDAEFDEQINHPGAIRFSRFVDD